MRTLALTAFLLAGCSASPEGFWIAEPEMTLRLSAGRYESLDADAHETVVRGYLHATELVPCQEAGAYRLDGADVVLFPDGEGCRPPRRFEWGGDELWLRGQPGEPPYQVVYERAD